MDKPLSSQSEEIQKILAEPDVWNTELSYVEIDQWYSSRRLGYTVNKLRERDKKDVIAAVVLPFLVAVVSFVGWASMLKAVGSGVITLVVTLGVIFFLHWLSAPKEMDEALRGDLRATRSQLAEEKRKSRRIAIIAEENEQKYLEATSRLTLPAPEWWLDELKKTHDLIPLQPNIVRPYQGSTVNAHSTEDGTIIEGPSTDKPAGNILAVIAQYQNSPDTRPKRRITAIAGVIGEITLTNFEEGKTSLKINQGAWLSEKDNKTNFNVTDKRGLIIGALREEESSLWAVRREFNSAYPNGHTFLDQLVGDLFAVRIRLIREADGSLLDDYQMMLEITREPELKLRLMNAASWKSEHLHNFVIEGFDSSMKLHEIWKEANSQFPQAAPRQFFSFAEAVSDATQASFSELRDRIAAMEREQEEKMLDSLKNWETRAADWLGLIIGTDARDQFLKSGPSFENGLNRSRRPPSLFLPTKEGEQRPAPKLPYWTLSDVVSSRTEALLRLKTGFDKTT